MRRILLLYTFSILSSGCLAQNKVPDTDIYLATLKNNNGKITVTDTVNITHRPGYDNQPYFYDNGNSILFVTYKQNAEIQRYDINSGNIYNVSLPFTKGLDAYSPNIVPGSKNVSVVMVEKDSTQRIWQIKISNSEINANEGLKNLFPNVKRVGYYCWIDKDHIAVDILEDSLKIYDIKNNKLTYIDNKTGRCIRKIPGENAISFVKKIADDDWEIMKLDLETNKTSVIVKCPKGSEDFDWAPDGSVYMGNAGKLLIWTKKSGTWQQIADFTGTPLENFYRLTVSPKGDRIAMVNYKGKKP